jgi:carbonic anhydrase/acetyltransferase-like protein (isoleucine patch superfamily)
MIRSLDGKSPKIDPTAFVSEAAYLVGDIEIGPRSSIWPGVVIRADAGKIKIGSGTNIQDNSVLHADADAEIGDNVTLGHGVICHAKYIGKNSLVASGSSLTENSVFADDSIIRGLPGKALGEVKEKHTEMMRSAAAFYVSSIAKYKEAGLGHDD